MNDPAPTPPPGPGASAGAAPPLAELAGDVERLEALLAGWDEDALRLQATALRQAVERLHAEALRRLLRAVKAVPGALPALRALVEDDEVVRGVLAYHGLLKAPADPLEARVRAALEAVRPSLEAHGGDVELVAIEPPEVRVRLVGSCVGCPSSMVTLVEGVERAVRERCAEITRVVSVSSAGRANGAHAAGADGPGAGLVSPFALARGRGQERVCRLEDLPDGAVRAVTVRDESVLLVRAGGVVRGFVNACAHLGMPLDDGEVVDGAIVCPHHGFRYSLETGECLTAPSVALPVVLVEVRGDEVFVRGRA